MANDSWRTPAHVFSWLNDWFGFDLDAAADESNYLCPRFHSFKSETDNGLTRPWADSTFCNPPYSKPNLLKFTEKAYLEGEKGNTCVLLIPLDITNWFRSFVKDRAEIWIPDERIAYIDPKTGLPDNSPPKGSMICIYGPLALVGYAKVIHIPKEG